MENKNENNEEIYVKTEKYTNERINNAKKC